ncbi:hypothetical protein QBC36DRAFT_235440 [Triangularia setosa]|uniref:Uncharacterized protein n=1 Tax=Triangularia setosa TaxID=2587417 RepID=A0AAN7A9F2_9PEZI|nr:hypothetical protein QBC36DRAFT_235440 [Podospora setosa]
MSIIEPPAGPTSIINPDITLLIAEKAGLSTVLSLTSTNKHLHALIHTYEHSIIKSKITAAIPNSSLRPPLGSLLSSRGPTRQILPPWSFQVAAELERRHSRIEAMFNPCAVPPTPLISAISRVPSFAALSPPQLLHLVTMFKRACRLADHISDLALLVKIPAIARDPPPADPYMVYKAIHRTRQAFIRGLKPLELALLTHLAALGGMAYAKEFGELLSSDPEGLERMVAYKETILREGSAALWGFLHPDEHGEEDSVVVGPASLPPKVRGSGLARYIAGKVEGVLKDLRAYEMGLKQSDDEVEVEDGEYLDWDREGGRDGIEVNDDDDDDPFVVLHGLHQTVMGAFPKPTEEPEESEEDAGFQYEEEGFEHQEGDLPDEDGRIQEEGEQTQEEVGVFHVEPREQLILEVVRYAAPC